MSFFKKFVAVLIGTIALVHTAFVSALPKNPEIISGTVFIETETPIQITVQSVSDRSIINWESFSLDASETIFFQLPSTNSAILNRVTTGTLSSIAGKIQSNGIVYLIDENGIVFEANSYVETNTFLASTLNTQDQAFISANLITFFSTKTNGVYNYGIIRAINGDVVIMGATVSNEGKIFASQGQVSFGAGQEIVLDPNNHDSIVIVTPTLISSASYQIDNKGLIACTQATLQTQATESRSSIQHSGLINAIGTNFWDSYVSLFAQQGISNISGAISLKDSNNTGGRLEIFAEDIILTPTCILDCSGYYGGGEIYLGGHLQNSDIQKYSAKNVTVSIGAQILNNAAYKNNGGRVVIWSKENTDFFGEVFACGGKFMGNGGLVQICSNGTLAFHGIVNNAAQNGKNGVLITDSHVLVFAP